MNCLSQHSTYSPQYIVAVVGALSALDPAVALVDLSNVHAREVESTDDYRDRVPCLVDRRRVPAKGATNVTCDATDGPIKKDE